MALGLLPAIRTDGVTDILVLVLMQFAEPSHRPLCNPCHPAYPSPMASTLPPNPHSARDTLIDHSPRVPSLEPFRRRPTARAATPRHRAGIRNASHFRPCAPNRVLHRTSLLHPRSSHRGIKGRRGDFASRGCPQSDVFRTPATRHCAWPKLRRQYSGALGRASRNRSILPRAPSQGFLRRRIVWRSWGSPQHHAIKIRKPQTHRQGRASGSKLQGRHEMSAAATSAMNNLEISAS